MNTILAVDHDLEPRRFAIVRVYTDGTRLLEKDCLTLQETAMYPAGPQTDDKGEFRYSQTLSSSLPKE